MYDLKKYFLLCAFLLIVSFTGYGQNAVLPLWPKEIPNHKNSDEKVIETNEDILWIEKVQIPTLSVFLPAKQQSTGRAVLICPGGGYAGLAYDWEGTDIAKWFNSKGIAACVLKYRLPNSTSVINREKVPLQDAQRALRMIRFYADKWNLHKEEIGVMGFSAGGHLASTLGTHFETKNEFTKDSVDQISARPDFMILIYPVITMKTPFTHGGSKDNLLGPDPSDAMIDLYSNELHITKDTPPTYLVHAGDDTVVPVENSLMFYQGLRDAGIDAELHIYPHGGHGFSLAIGKGHLQTWTNTLYRWILSLNK